jgi:hypothetical protein
MAWFSTKWTLISTRDSLRQTKHKETLRSITYSGYRITSYDWRLIPWISTIVSQCNYFISTYTAIFLRMQVTNNWHTTAQLDLCVTACMWKMLQPLLVYYLDMCNKDTINPGFDVAMTITNTYDSDSPDWGILRNLVHVVTNHWQQTICCSLTWIINNWWNHNICKNMNIVPVVAGLNFYFHPTWVAWSVHSLCYTW